MPELPEVETVRRGLQPVLEGQTIEAMVLRRRDLRWPIPEGLAAAAQGQSIAAVTRRGKYILVEFRSGAGLLVHLGMSGRVLIHAQGAPEPGKHDHWDLTTAVGTCIRFHDPRRFGSLDFVPAEGWETHALLRDMGPEPLTNQFDGPLLGARLAGRRTPIKAALLDQRVVAGLGNIYVCEALYRAGLSPRRQAHTVAGARADRLAEAIRAVLNDAIAAGGSTLRDYRAADGDLGYFQYQFSVYGREGAPCPGCDCGNGVQRLVQSGRSTFYCPKRQR
ncbi:MAG: bifunctional DNA-formamidopyrimidine glycosylase/DNA-(apurinic or apyrimidinic site) lyase [Magnetospiraceae bacterium]